jgi:deoxycytidylate deaminase
LIQAGIVEVVYTETNNIPERWQEDFIRSTNMMKEAGIKLRTIEFE